MNKLSSKHCHLLKSLDLSKDEITDSLQLLHTYLDDSHEIRKLFRCKLCNQLYFYEFKEEIDYENGDDAQFRIWIPVDNELIAANLSKENSISLLSYPQIRIDWPSDAEKPTKPYFTGKIVENDFK